MLAGRDSAQKNEAILRSLLDHGANVNAVDQDGETALLAAMAGDAPHQALRLGTLLLAHGAHANVRDRIWGRTPLMFAALADNASILPLLLAHGAEINARDTEGETALWHAVDCDSASEVAVLLQAGIAVNARDKQGHTVLWYAEDRKVARVMRPDDWPIEI